MRTDPHQPFDVTIVSPTYPSSNPRVVKEADALHQAGLRVCLVFSQGGFDWARQDDASMLRTKPWRSRAVSWSPSIPGERGRYLVSTLRFHLARRAPKLCSLIPGVAERGECRTYPELAAAAIDTPARLYIGHYPEGLAAAAKAADRNAARLAYDIEDLHTSEDSPTPVGRRRTERVDKIERRYLPRCSYVSAVSEGVAQAVASRYGIAEPIVVHNVFPWSDRDRIDGQRRDRNGAKVSLIWYSQVVGLDRGIGDAIRALGLLKTGIELHIRGWYDFAIEGGVRRLAGEVGVGDRVFLHQRVSPTDLLSRTAEHDVGLALERTHPLNRALTVTNKLFFYLLAGLAVIATDTPGQRRILEQTQVAGDLYSPGDHPALAKLLQKLLTEPGSLEQRKRAALRAAQNRWNWEQESGRLVESVSRVLDQDAAI